MTENLIILTDGSRLTIKINFATLYYIQKSKKIEKLVNKNPEDMTDDEAMEVAAEMIYCIMRSNGKAVTFDEALMLTPPDIQSIEKILREFTEKLNDYKKKEEAKKNMRNFTTP